VVTSTGLKFAGFVAMFLLGYAVARPSVHGLLGRESTGGRSTLLLERHARVVLDRRAATRASCFPAVMTVLPAGMLKLLQYSGPSIVLAFHLCLVAGQPQRSVRSKGRRPTESGPLACV
jgi:hypothetical protein